MAEEDVACIGPTSNKQNEFKAAINVPSASSDTGGKRNFLLPAFLGL
ncbi:MAG: hypothetical protein OSB45_04120 [Pseudomonadales bacterium]|jgi:hypothetical protein|nr:hypothetical protein [Pseudomonadales bacterium]